MLQWLICTFLSGMQPKNSHCLLYFPDKLSDLDDQLNVNQIHHHQNYLTSILLLSKARDGEYIFETRANNSTARTPMGAFDELEIPNDITKVLEVIKDY